MRITLQRALRLSPAGLGLLAAACGYGATGGYGGNAGAVAQTPSTTSVAVATSHLGKVLTDGEGRTLYLFTKDANSSSSCNPACLSVWPAFAASGGAQAGTGASSSLLGTTAAGAQITYNGHPLYYYAGDSKAGDTNGQDLNQFGGSWYVVSPSGAQVGG